MANLTIVPPSSVPATPPRPSRASKPTARDRRRYALAKRGHTTEEIAGLEATSTDAIEKSILKVTLYNDAYSHEMVDIGVNELVLARLDLIGDTIDRSLAAKRQVPDGNGGMIEEWDHDTGLKAIKTMKELVESIRPKGSGVNVNVQQNNLTQNNIGERSFEERLRAIRERNGLSNDDPATIEADVVDDSADFDESADDADDDATADTSQTDPDEGIADESPAPEQ